MADVLYTEAARSDLIELWRYYALVDEALADRILNRIDLRIQLLADQPLLGRGRPEFDLPGLRSIASRPHVIFYSVPNEDQAVIHRVVDGRRDLPSLLKPQDLEST